MYKTSPKNLDTKTKIYYLVISSLILVAVAITFFKYFVFKDYVVVTQVECDPTLERCFVAACDPSQDETCSENPSEQTSYYKIIQKKASHMPMCDPADATCIVSCSGDLSCKEILCDDLTTQDGESCSDPGTQTTNNSDELSTQPE